MHPLVSNLEAIVLPKLSKRLKQIVRACGPYRPCIYSFLHPKSKIIIYFTFFDTGQRQRDDARQFDIFFLSSDVQKGKRYYIEMNFTGPLTGDLVGLYLSQYQRNDETMYVSVLN